MYYLASGFVFYVNYLLVRLLFILRHNNIIIALISKLIRKNLILNLKKDLTKDSIKFCN